jgi:hypothetical protein
LLAWTTGSAVQNKPDTPKIEEFDRYRSTMSRGAMFNVQAAKDLKLMDESLADELRERKDRLEAADVRSKQKIDTLTSQLEGLKKNLAVRKPFNQCLLETAHRITFGNYGRALQVAVQHTH